MQEIQWHSSTPAKEWICSTAQPRGALVSHKDLKGAAARGVWEVLQPSMPNGQSWGIIPSGVRSEVSWCCSSHRQTVQDNFRYVLSEEHPSWIFMVH